MTAIVDYTDSATEPRFRSSRAAYINNSLRPYGKLAAGIGLDGEAGKASTRFPRTQGELAELAEFGLSISLCQHLGVFVCIMNTTGQPVSIMVSVTTKSDWLRIPKITPAEEQQRRKIAPSPSPH